MPPVSRSTTSPVYQKLLDQARTLASDGKLSTGDVDTLIDAAINDKKLSAPERAAIKQMATQFASQLESPDLGARLKSFSQMTHAGIRGAVREAEKGDGVVDATEARALAETLQQGKLNQAARYTLAAVLVGARLTPEAKDILTAVKNGDPLPDTTKYIDPSVLQSMEDKMQSRAFSDGTSNSSVTRVVNKQGEKFYAGDWVGQAYVSADSWGAMPRFHVMLAHPDGRLMTLKDGAARMYLTCPPELQGRAVYEVMGAPTGGGGSYSSAFTFEAGKITFDSYGYGTPSRYEVGDVAARLDAVKDTPRSDLSLVAAAEILKENFAAVSRAVGDSHTPFITLRDLEVAALDPARSPAVRSAARSLVSSGGFVAAERAGKADDRITLADLTALAAGGGGLGTRPLQFKGMVAADYMDTSGPTGRPVGRDRRLSMSLRAVPGAEITISNRMVPDGEGPKAIFKFTVPMGNAGGDGLVDVNLQIPKEADWALGDKVELTQKVGGRDASAPTVVDLVGKGWNPDQRPTILDTAKLSSGSDGWIKTSGSYTVRPYSWIQIIKDGVDTGVGVQANAYGQFELKLPGSLQQGNWELRVGDQKHILAGQPVDSRARADGWVKDLNKVFLAAPRNNTITGEIKGLLPGYTATVQNPANGPEVHTFTADANGVMKVNVPSVASGDTLHITYAEAELADYHLPQTKFTIAAPTAAEAERINVVLSSIKATTERDRFFALELFGPYSANAELKAMTDPVKMQAYLDGARMGAFLSSRGLAADWKARIVGAVNQAGKADVLAGMMIGETYRGPHSPVNGDDLGFKLIKPGETRIVITGGYSPISGSHGPLTPEYVTGPAQYELNFLGMPPLRLETRGGQPQGWVNPNAMLLTYTRHVG